MTTGRWKKEMSVLVSALFSIFRMIWRLNNKLGPLSFVLVGAGALVAGTLGHSPAWGTAILLAELFALAFLEIWRRERSAKIVSPTPPTQTTQTVIFNVSGDYYANAPGPTGGARNSQTPFDKYLAEQLQRDNPNRQLETGPGSSTSDHTEESFVQEDHQIEETGTDESS